MPIKKIIIIILLFKESRDNEYCINETGIETGEDSDKNEFYAVDQFEKLAVP